MLSSAGQWVKPHHGRLKCNIDVTFSEPLIMLVLGYVFGMLLETSLRQRSCGLIPYVHGSKGERWVCYKQFIGYIATTFKC